MLITNELIKSSKKPRLLNERKNIRIIIATLKLTIDDFSFFFISFYFSRSVLQTHKSTGIDDLGPPQWDMLLTLLLVYCILYFSLFKGVKASGKITYHCLSLKSH